MKKQYLFLLFLLQSQLMSAQGTLSPAAGLLFRNSVTKATVAEKNKIIKDLELTLSADKKGLMISEFPVTSMVYPTDLNKDGREELFIVLGSTSMYGMTGQATEMYFQNKEGKFVRQADLSGTGSISFLTTKNLGWPDYIIGGPGFEFPMYRWNGTTYKYSKMIKDAALSKMPMIELDSLSRMYERGRK